MKLSSAIMPLRKTKRTDEEERKVDNEEDGERSIPTTKTTTTTTTTTTTQSSSSSSAVGLWMFKKQMAALIGTYQYGSRPREGALKCLHLLRRYPQLAKVRFDRRRCRAAERDYCSSYLASGSIYPLSFVMEMGADLTIVTEIHGMFPQALLETTYQKKKKNNNNKSSKNMTTPSSSYPQEELIITGGGGDLPLHHACQLGLVSSDVIQFIANANPLAVSTMDSLSHWPIHSLLRNSHRSASVAEIDTLLRIYPNAIDMDCGGGSGASASAGTPIVLALKSRRTTQAVLERLIYHYCNSNSNNSNSAKKEFRLPTRETVIKVVEEDDDNDDEVIGRYIRSYDKIHTITLANAQALSSMLGHLHTFTCLPKRWHRDAFCYLMESLSSNDTCSSKVIDLTLHIPPSLLLFCDNHNNDNDNDNENGGSSGDDDDNKVYDSVQRLLERNTTLKYLHIDFGMEQRSIGAATTTVKKIKKFLRGLTAGLCNNSSLRVCYLSGTSIITTTQQIPGETLLDQQKFDVLRKELWIPLATNNLQHTNLTLERISLSSSISTSTSTSRRRQQEYYDHHSVKQLLPPEGIQVQYWTALNRYGRSIARDPNSSINDLIQLLTKVLQKTTRTTTTTKKKIENVGILYGLLLECPGLWSTTAN